MECTLHGFNITAYYNNSFRRRKQKMQDLQLFGRRFRPIPATFSVEMRPKISPPWEANAVAMRNLRTHSPSRLNARAERSAQFRAASHGQPEISGKSSRRCEESQTAFTKRSESPDRNRGFRMKLHPVAGYYPMRSSSWSTDFFPKFGFPSLMIKHGTLITLYLSRRSG